MNSVNINNNSSAVTATQLSELQSALKLQEQAVVANKELTDDRSISPSTTVGTKVDISI